MAEDDRGVEGVDAGSDELGAWTGSESIMGLTVVGTSAGRGTSWDAARAGAGGSGMRVCAVGAGRWDPEDDASLRAFHGLSL